MDEANDNSLVMPLVFNSADWNLVQTQPFWHSAHYDREVERQIKERMSKRGNVWGVGFWPDAETEKVARQCAEIFEEEFGLPNSSLIPDDSVMVLQTWGDGLDACEAVVALENAFGCVIDGEKLGKIRENGDVFFKDVVTAVLETRGAKPVKHPPPEPGVSKSRDGACMGCVILLLIACWPVIAIMALASVTFWICNHCSGVCPEIVVGAAIALWMSIVAFVTYWHGRDYVCTNILRFLISTGLGLYVMLRCVRD